MKIGQIAFEGRKLELNRREVNELYRKNKDFIQSNKKRMITILENLLNDERENNSAESFSNKVDHHIDNTSQEKTDNDLINNIEEEIETLEEVRNAALSTPSPSIQDLRIAIAASNQLSLLKDKVNTSNEEQTQINLELLERLKNQVFLPSEIVTAQNNNNIEQIKFNKKFQTAIRNYKNQMNLARNNFEFEEPKYTLIA